jgi:pimeloyl-ACP methyl ester carboxylesterase
VGLGTAAALFLAATSPERVTSLTIGGGAVRFPVEAGGALEQTIGAPSLDVIRGLDARANISAAVEIGAPSGTEPEVHEDYVSAYDLGRFAESARFVRHYPEQNKILADLLPNAEIHPLDAGHFAWEEAPSEYGSLIADWIRGQAPAGKA